MSQSCVKLASCLIGWHRPILVRLLGSRPLLRCPSLCVPACLFSHGLSRSDILRVLTYVPTLVSKTASHCLAFFFLQRFYLFIDLRERQSGRDSGGRGQMERQRNMGRLWTERGAQRLVRSHNPGTVTRAENKSRTLNWLRTQASLIPHFLSSWDNFW